MQKLWSTYLLYFFIYSQLSLIRIRKIRTFTNSNEIPRSPQNFLTNSHGKNLLHLSSCIVSLKLQRNSYSRYHFRGSQKSSLWTFKGLFSSNGQRLSDLFRHKLQTFQHDCLVPPVRWAFLPHLESIFPCKHDDFGYSFLIQDLCLKLLEFHLENK